MRHLMTCAVLAALVLYVLARLAVAAWSWLELHPLLLLLAAAVAGLAVAGRLVLAADRMRRAGWAGARCWPLALWHRCRWRAWCAREGLAYPDRHRRRSRPGAPGARAVAADGAPVGRMVYPAARFHPSPVGWQVDVKTIAKVGAVELEDAAAHLADEWRCARVSVSQRRPGMVRLLAVRRDPLAATLPASVLPPFDGRSVLLGRDEHGDLRRMSLANHSGSCWAGIPGRGKTQAGLSIAAQLVPSPAVQLWVADGGELDWAPFAAGAHRFATDLADVVELLREADELMRARRRSVNAELGVRNAWHVGPRPPGDGWPLVWLMVEEAPAFYAAAGDKKRKELADEAKDLTANLLRRGRAAMVHVSLVTQKPTGTSGMPPDLRDLCGVRWSFGVNTLDAASAILGADIREHASVSPTNLLGDEHVGIASVLLGTGRSPYTLLKFPHITDSLIDQVAAELAERGRPQQLAVVPELHAVPELPAEVA